MSEKSTVENVKATYASLRGWERRLHILAGVLLVVGLGMKGVAVLTGGGDRAGAGDGVTAEAPADTVASGKRGEPKTGDAGAGLLPGEPRIPGAEPPETGDSAPPAAGEEPPPVGGGPFLDEWSPTMVKGGLSFFVAFWIGYSIRVFAKICGLFVGLFCVGMLGLQQLGWVTVEWSVAQAQFSSLPDLIATQFEGFKIFLQGSLPSAAMASLGLFTGLRKK